MCAKRFVIADETVFVKKRTERMEEQQDRANQGRRQMFRSGTFSILMTSLNTFFLFYLSDEQRTTK